ncbi:hypothetical protein [Maricaulis sp.]|uniref:hypothetical protein n=1 Tax=Maricaulis sp. TaxID=1486257 RepID=UPI003A8DBA92
MSDMLKFALSRAEALVLFDALSRLVDSDGFADAAEDLAANSLLCALERDLAAVVDADYAFLVARAKEELTEEIDD